MKLFLKIGVGICALFTSFNIYRLNVGAVGLAESAELVEFFTDVTWLYTFSNGVDYRPELDGNSIQQLDELAQQIDDYNRYALNNNYETIDSVNNWYVQTIVAPTQADLDALGLAYDQYGKFINHGLTLYKAYYGVGTTYYFKDSQGNVYTEDSVIKPSPTLTNVGFGLSNYLTNNYTESLKPVSSVVHSVSELPLDIAKRNDGSYSVRISDIDNPLVKFFIYKDGNNLYVYYVLPISNRYTHINVNYFWDNYGYYMSTEYNVSLTYTTNAGKQYAYSQTAFINSVANGYPLIDTVPSLEYGFSQIDVVPSSDSASILTDSLGDVYTVPDISALLNYGTTISDIYELVDELKSIIQSIPKTDSYDTVITDSISSAITKAVTDVITAIRTDTPITPDMEIPQNIFDIFKSFYDLPKFIFSSIFKPIFDIFGEYSVYSLYLFFPSVIIIFLIFRSLLK